MNEQQLTEMNYDEFTTLLDNYIERSSQQTGEMDAIIFFELLFDRAMERVEHTIKLECRIVNGQLIFNLPMMASPYLYVQNNQILIDKQRIIVNLVNEQAV